MIFNGFFSLPAILTKVSSICNVSDYKRYDVKDVCPHARPLRFFLGKREKGTGLFFVSPFSAWTRRLPIIHHQKVSKIRKQRQRKCSNLYNNQQEVQQETRDLASSYHV